MINIVIDVLYELILVFILMFYIKLCTIPNIVYMYM